MPASANETARHDARPVVLIVDDEPGVRASVKAILERECEVLEAADGRAALELVQSRSVDLCLLDVRLPGMNGITVLERLKRLDADLEVVLLTAILSDRIAAHAQRLGAYACLSKPFGVDDLWTAVRRALERRALLHQIAALQEENRAKDEFLAILGHELRNPLGAITAAVVALDHLEINADEAKELRAIIARQAARQARLVDDLLDVSRVSSGKITLERAPLDLKTIAEHCLASFEQAGRTREHNLSLAGESVWVEGDAMRLEQVVTNLLDNALKYTPTGGRIEIMVKPDAAWAVFRVRDSGIGVSPELLPHVFDPFRQDRQAVDRAQGGLGLGLALVRHLVELHGGRVTAESAGPGSGSEFVIRLPLRSDSPAVDDTHAPEGSLTSPTAA